MSCHPHYTTKLRQATYPQTVGQRFILLDTQTVLRCVDFVTKDGTKLLNKAETEPNLSGTHILEVRGHGTARQDTCDTSRAPRDRPIASYYPPGRAVLILSEHMLYDLKCHNPL